MCVGLAVQWDAGSIWESHAYQEHDDDILGWKPIVACVHGRLFYPVAAGVDHDVQQQPNLDNPKFWSRWYYGNRWSAMNPDAERNSQ